MRESKIEKYLNDQCKLLGWTTRKFTSPGRAKVSDRLIVPLRRPMALCEVKAEDVDINATPHGRAQVREQQRMRDLGHQAYVVASTTDVDEMLQEIAWGEHWRELLDTNEGD